MKRVEITVSPKGETKVETKGFTGSDCRNASQFVSKALGHKTAEQLKPEFHSQTSCDHQVERGQ